MVKSPQTILRMLRSEKIIVKVHAFSGTNKGLNGYCYPPEFRVVHINNNMVIKWRVSTLVHECLHLLNTQTKEKKILEIEKEVFAKLSKTAYNSLSKYVA